MLRLRENDPEERNFVHGAYLFVSTTLVSKVKRYISKSQGEAIDLFVTTKLLELEKPSVVGIYLDEYLHPKTADPRSKVTKNFEIFAAVDSWGYFYPVFLQELDFVGTKVFGGRRDDRIIQEVNELAEFLVKVGERKVGEEGDLEFCRDYCRCGIVIIGKGPKVQMGPNPWTTLIRKQMIPGKVETIYLLGRIENRDVMDQVCNSLEDEYETFRKLRNRVRVRYGDDREQVLKQYIVVLRNRGVEVYQPAA